VEAPAGRMISSLKLMYCWDDNRRPSLLQMLVGTNKKYDDRSNKGNGSKTRSNNHHTKGEKKKKKEKTKIDLMMIVRTTPRKAATFQKAIVSTITDRRLLHQSMTTVSYACALRSVSQVYSVVKST
jgi:hypothetical protein